jgi:hypothetical protein
MNLKELQGFYEAYMNVYEEVGESEELDEVTGMGGQVNARTGNYDKELNPQLKRSPELSDPSGMQKTPLEKAREKEKVVRETDPKRANRLKRGISTMYRPEVKYAQGFAKGKSQGRREMQDSYEVDNYDLVLEYLLDEGFCETEDKAEAMMAHMSEGWIESIIDEAKCDEGLSDAEKEMKRKQRGNGGPTSHNLRQGKKTRGNMSHKYESGKYQD